MIYDKSYGVIPLALENGEWKVFLVKHQNGSHWGFPKGHKESSETPLQTALRELKEETNLDFKRLLLNDPLEEEYQYIKNEQMISKKVSYFVAEVSGSVVLQSLEIEKGKWLLLKEAQNLISFLQSRSICKKVEAILEKV